MSLPLAGHCILVTRPQAQSAALAQKIRDAGGEALVFPTIAIHPVVNDTLALQIDQLHEFDAAAFISPNAAQYGAVAVRARREFPPHLTIYAVGSATARALARQGLLNATHPNGQDSEALLALPQLHNIAGQRIVIFRGVGGRAFLADILRARGAKVEYAECYRRVRPEVDAGPLLAQWLAGGVSAVTITSAKSLQNLGAMLGGIGVEHLRTTPVFASHEKIAAAARQFGIYQVIATAAGDDGLLAGLITWFRTHA